MKGGTKPVINTQYVTSAKQAYALPLNGDSGNKRLPDGPTNCRAAVGLALTSLHALEMLCIRLLLTPWMAAQVSLASFLADVRALSRGTRPLIMDSLLTAAKGPILHQEHWKVMEAAARNCHMEAIRHCLALSELVTHIVCACSSFRTISSIQLSSEIRRSKYMTVVWSSASMAQSSKGSWSWASMA